MESSGQSDEDIKAECIEIISSIDADSATTSFLSGESEAGSDRNSAYMYDGTEATSGGNTMILLDGPVDRDGNMGKPERETIVSLIEMVRSQPEIWDITNTAYREKLLRKKSFRRIGEQLGWSTEDVIKKYNNLRTYYTKEIIKQKRSVSYHSKWPYFQQLDSFLRRTVHKRQPARLAIANKWSRLNSRNTPDNMQFPVGFRRKRQMLNSGDVRQRSNFNRVAATLSTPPPETTKQASAPSTSSSVGSRMPLNTHINISHVRSLASQQQQPRETPSTATSARVPRQQSNLQQSRQTANLSLPATSSSSVPSRALPLLQRKQMQSQNQIHIQQQQQQQQQPHPRMLQQQESRPKSPPPSTASSVSKLYQAASSLPPAPSGQALMESNDVIFGRLVTSQLSRIPEGRKKEQLKISLMQQLVQAMFEKEQS